MESMQKGANKSQQLLQGGAQNLCKEICILILMHTSDVLRGISFEVLGARSSCNAELYWLILQASWPGTMDSPGIANTC